MRGPEKNIGSQTTQKVTQPKNGHFQSQIENEKSVISYVDSAHSSRPGSK